MRRPRRSLGYERVFIAVVFLITAVVPASAAQSLAPVTVSMVTNNATVWPILVAIDRGFFSDAGIEVTPILSGASAKAAQQVASGSVNIGNASVVDTFRAIDAGAKIKIFLNSQAVGIHMLIAAKSIKSMKDLKGKRVETGGPKDVTNLWWEAMAKHYGLDPQHDVDLIFAGASSARYAALISGAIDATLLTPPQSFAAIKEGYTNLGLAAPYLGDFPQQVYSVDLAWAATHEKEVLAFVRGINRAAQFTLDRANRTVVAGILAKAARLPMNESLQTYDLVVDAKAFVADGAIPSSALERVRTALDEAGDLKRPLKPIDAYFDSKYVDVVVAK